MSRLSWFTTGRRRTHQSLIFSDTSLYGNTSVKVHPARSSPFLLVQYERSEGSPLAGAMRATTLYSVEST